MTFLIVLAVPVQEIQTAPSLPHQMVSANNIRLLSLRTDSIMNLAHRLVMRTRMKFQATLMAKHLKIIL